MLSMAVLMHGKLRCVVCDGRERRLGVRDGRSCGDGCPQRHRTRCARLCARC